MSDERNESDAPTGSACELCAGTCMVEIIPHGGGAADSISDECPRCLREQLACDWPDPGQYEHKCIQCQRTFYGGKRRVFCRKCQTPNAPLSRSSDEAAGSDCSAWPARDIVAKLVESADILLDAHDYDGHGWELVHEARAHAREWLSQNDAADLRRKENDGQEEKRG